MFSDVYAAQGMHIVLSGTDSLGFWLSQYNELYDRAKIIHTTFIPYREHARLLGSSDIDEYIRYGGTLRAGSIDFANVDEQAFFMMTKARANTLIPLFAKISSMA